MSDNPKKKSDFTDYEKISSEESKPNEVIIENAEPGSNPSTLSTPDKSLAEDSKISPSPKTRGDEQSQYIEDNLEANYESNDFLLEPSQNNAGYNSQNNAENQ